MPWRRRPSRGSPTRPGWARRGFEATQRELDRQTDADGLNRELASEYHGLVLELGLAGPPSSSWPVARCPCRSPPSWCGCSTCSRPRSTPTSSRPARVTVTAASAGCSMRLPQPVGHAPDDRSRDRWALRLVAVVAVAGGGSELRDRGAPCAVPRRSPAAGDAPRLLRRGRHDAAPSRRRRASCGAVSTPGRTASSRSPPTPTPTPCRPR